MPRLLPALLLLAACQEPFEVTRKDLGPFRIAALGVHDGVARVAVWSGEGLYHPERLTLSWTLDGEPLGEGFDVEVTGEGTLGVVATSASGEALEAEVSVAEAPAALDVQRYALGVVEDVTLEARRALDTTPIDHGVGEGEAVRVELLSPPEGASARWMTAAGEGSLLEVEDFAADVLPEELEFDEGEVVAREPTGAGLYHQLALVLDGEGGNTWSWVDVAIGLDGPFMQQGARLVPLDAVVEPGLVALTLTRDDSLGGFAFTDALSVSDLSEMDLDCAIPDQPFDLDQVAEGRCGADELDGARVVMELE